MERKETIFHAATRLFADKGYKETSMSEVAKLTGVAQGTIFYHFKSKEDLFLAILEEFKSNVNDEFEKWVNNHSFSNGLDMLESALDFYLYLASIMEDRFMILYRHDAYELALHNPIFGQYLESIYDHLVDIFEKAIISGRNDGSIADVSPKKNAMLIFTMVDGLVRFNTYKLYDAGTLYDELVKACRKILTQT
ncbi:MAG: TetR/AcrR family transcriptional regulator [Deltaproteobacteria bacterium]|nr:TetR/AcrR family transcriptional regulator [Deltaproteobacteria bacterium]